jgi:hypothetical protein
MLPQAELSFPRTRESRRGEADGWTGMVARFRGHDEFGGIAKASADELLRALRGLAEAHPQGVVDTLRVVAEPRSAESAAPRGQS